MRTTRLSLLAALVATMLATPAVAGPADSPLPLLSGEKTKHVFTVPGVVRSADLTTIFICTSLEKSRHGRFGVEVFSSDGGDPLNDVSAGNGTSGVDAGETDSVSTAGISSLSGADIISGLTPSEVPRSARIVSTTSKLACSAIVLDPLGDPPSVAWELPVIKKTSQKGD